MQKKIYHEWYSVNGHNIFVWIVHSIHKHWLYILPCSSGSALRLLHISKHLKSKKFESDLIWQYTQIKKVAILINHSVRNQKMMCTKNSPPLSPAGSEISVGAPSPPPHKPHSDIQTRNERRRNGEDYFGPLKRLKGIGKYCIHKIMFCQLVVVVLPVNSLRLWIKWPNKLILFS